MARSVCRTLVVLIATLYALGAGSAFSQDPVDRPSDATCVAPLFKGYTPTFQSGDSLPKEGVFAIALRPIADVFYFAKAAKGTSTGYGGVVTFESLWAGRYAVVLSQPAQLEAIQQRPLVEVSVAFRSGDPSCPGTAEFVTEGGSLTLQISEVVTPSILVAVIRLAD